MLVESKKVYGLTLTSSYVKKHVERKQNRKKTEIKKNSDEKTNKLTCKTWKNMEQKRD